MTIDKEWQDEMVRRGQAIDDHPDAEVLAEMWALKGEGKDHFAHATLLEPVEMRVWNGRHPVEDNTEKHTAPIGARVLITVASRLGDFGIRDNDVDDLHHGYHARVSADVLKDIQLCPQQEENEDGDDEEENGEEDNG